MRELDDEAPASIRRLPRPLRRRLAALRQRAEPDEAGAHALLSAERAADAYEKTLDEALGLGAELNKWIRPPWPERAVLVRWAAFTGLALAMLGTAVHNLRLTDFMLRALGVDVGVVRPQLTEARIFFDLEASMRDAAPGTESEAELLDRIVVEAMRREREIRER